MDRVNTVRRTSGATMRAMIWVGAMALVGAAGVGAAGLFAGTQRAALAAQPSATTPYPVDPVHSSVLFRIKHNNVSFFYGRFNDVSGSFFIDQEDASKSTMSLTVKVDSVDTGIGGRNDHLKSQQFFNATEFPEMTFKSTAFSKTGESTYTVTGDLTMRGVTKPVTVTLEDTGRGAGGRGGQVAGFEAITTIKRSDFGMNYMVDRGLGDDVRLIVSLQGNLK